MKIKTCLKPPPRKWMVDCLDDLFFSKSWLERGVKGKLDVIGVLLFFLGGEVGSNTEIQKIHGYLIFVDVGSFLWSYSPCIRCNSHVLLEERIPIEGTKPRSCNM